MNFGFIVGLGLGLGFGVMLGLAFTAMNYKFLMAVIALFCGVGAAHAQIMEPDRYLLPDTFDPPPSPHSICEFRFFPPPIAWTPYEKVCEDAHPDWWAPAVSPADR